MKPLELRTFDIDDNAQGWAIGSECPPFSEWPTIPGELAESIARGKRLTGPELAAEWWKAWCRASVRLSQHRTAEAMRERHIARTLERFATLPHASEGGYQ